MRIIPQTLEAGIDRLLLVAYGLLHPLEVGRRVQHAWMNKPLRVGFLFLGYLRPKGQGTYGPGQPVVEISPGPNLHVQNSPIIESQVQE